MMEPRTFENLLDNSARVRPGLRFIRDPALQAKANASGLHYDFDFLPLQDGGELVAVFRSRQTVDAIREAGPAAVQFLQDSGFALVAFDSGVPPGHHLPEEAPLREALVEKLHEHLSSPNASTLNWGRFDPLELMHAIEASKPISDRSLIAFPISLRQKWKKQERQARREQRVRRWAVSGLSVGLLLISLSIYLATGGSLDWFYGWQAPW